MHGIGNLRVEGDVPLQHAREAALLMCCRLTKVHGARCETTKRE
jgi:hypothetical protein